LCILCIFFKTKIMADNMWTDDIGRCYCKAHRREQCHVCCYDFDMLNRQAEINAGIRKPPSEIETLAEQRGMLLKGIKFMDDNRQLRDPENYTFHLNELKKVEKRLAELKSTGADVGSITSALQAAQLKERARDAEMAAITAAWSKENPGKTTMEFGGPETQKLYDQFASAPPSASIDRTDKLVCGYCGKSSTERLMLCSRCKAVAYCDKECQLAAWKGHKKICKPKTVDGESTEKTKQPKLPLTWEQLEAFGGAPVVGKVNRN
jgi:hypothetical protein